MAEQKIRFKNILVCLDLSEMDHFLVNYTNYIIGTFKPEKLVFIHVMDRYDLPDEITRTIDDSGGELEDMVREELDELIREGVTTKSDTEISLELEIGLPAEKLLHYAGKNKFDLIVLGKKTGYSGKGSMARRIVGLVPASVLVVNETSRQDIRKMLVRMEFSRTSASTLKVAQGVAGFAGADIECHHVYKLPLHYFPRQTPENLKKLKAQVAEVVEREYAKFISKMRVKEPPPVSYSLEAQADESQLLYNYAIKHGFDLIITGSQIKSPLAGLILDRTSEKLVSGDKSIPVLVVKDKKHSVGILKAIFD